MHKNTPISHMASQFVMFFLSLLIAVNNNCTTFSARPVGPVSSRSLVYCGALNEKRTN